MISRESSRNSATQRQHLDAAARGPHARRGVAWIEARPIVDAVMGLLRRRRIMASTNTPPRPPQRGVGLELVGWVATQPTGATHQSRCNERRRRGGDRPSGHLNIASDKVGREPRFFEILKSPQDFRGSSRGPHCAPFFDKWHASNRSGRVPPARPERATRRIEDPTRPAPLTRSTSHGPRNCNRVERSKPKSRDEKSPQPTGPQILKTTCRHTTPRRTKPKEADCER